MGPYGGKDVSGISRKAVVQFSVLQVHCLELGSKAKVTQNCRFTIVPIRQRLRLFFAFLFLQTSSVFTEQSQKCAKSTNHSRQIGATRCQRGIKFHTRFERDQDRKCLWIVMTLANKDLLLQQYGERIEKLSQQDKLSNFCTDAGFRNVVEIGQYFMTKDTADFSQFYAVACREYTLPRDEESSQPKGWIQGNTKIGPILEVATCCLHGEYGVEIRIMSLNRQFSLLGQNFSWIKHVCDEFEQQWNRNSRSSARRICVKIGCEGFCMPIKG